LPLNNWARPVSFAGNNKVMAVTEYIHGVQGKMRTDAKRRQYSRLFIF
jgi:hypothetical protein